MEYSFFSLSQIDSWFFKESRAMDPNESIHSPVESLFPPPMSTTIGVMRYAFACANGWKGLKTWSKPVNCQSEQASNDLTRVLGDGPPPAIGSLRFLGPFLRKNGKLYFPLPLHYVAEKEQWYRYVPGPRVTTDMGLTCLPQLENNAAPTMPLHKMASASGHFIAKDDLERVVSGAPLTGNMVFSASDFWETEQRIGLGRTEERTAKDGALYTTSHIRLHDKQEEVDIVVGVAGFEDLHRPEGLYTYGGEGRLAYIAPIDVPSDSLFFPNAVKDEAKKATFAVALSPVYLESTAENAATNLHVLPDMACQINGTVANILTCCTKEPLSFGGWDSKSWQGTQIRSYIPAGTVLFFKDPLPFAPATWGEMGNNAECGFGSLLFGTLFNG